MNRNTITLAQILAQKCAKEQVCSFSSVTSSRFGAVEGETTLVVRATDGDGKLQISEYRDQMPDEATGLHRVRAFVEKA